MPISIESYSTAIYVADKIRKLASINIDADSLKQEIEESCRMSGQILASSIGNFIQVNNESQAKALENLDIPDEVKSILKSECGGIKSKLELTVEMQSLRIAALESAKNE